MKKMFVTAVAVMSATVATASAQSTMSPNSAPPAAPRPVPGRPPAPAPDMQAVLTAQQQLGAKPVETLSPLRARLLPSVQDGARAVMRAKGLSTAPDPAVTTQDIAYGADPMQYARIYKPAAPSTGRLPLIVYYHGGGWVIADVNVYDPTPRLLAKQLGAIVVSVEYRHAPEFKFPAQHEDAATAYRWVLRNAESWGADVRRIALAGESAGGNLAVATAIVARDNRWQKPAHILAVYPIANSSMDLPSRKDSANAKPLNGAMLNWFGYFYSKTPADTMDPRINLVAATLRDLPPVTIVNAQIDPLRSDGETLAQSLRTAGVSVEQRTYPGATHEFFGLGPVVKVAADAEAYAVARLAAAFGK